MHYRSVAFGGGGMKGGAHIGAIRALREHQGSLDFPDGVYGSSIGAFAAALVAFRVDPEKIEAAYLKLVTRSAFLPTPSVQRALSFFDRRGLFTMDKLKAMMLEYFTECGIPDAETKRICDAPQTLFVVASNMTTGRPTILTGEVPLVDAILCSSCIPGVFEPQVLYGQVYLDAGVYVRCIEQIVPRETLVFQLMDTRAPITASSSFGDILYACYMGERKPCGRNVCAFRGLEVGVLDDVSQADRERLVREGYLQTLAFLTKRIPKERE